MNRAALLTKLFRRNAHSIVETPEGRLWLAVIHEALTKNCRENLTFIQSKQFEAITSSIGLNPEFCCESIIRFDKYKEALR